MDNYKVIKALGQGTWGVVHMVCAEPVRIQHCDTDTLNVTALVSSRQNKKALDVSLPSRKSSPSDQRKESTLPPSVKSSCFASSSTKTSFNWLIVSRLPIKPSV
jgi:hypothetical protein